MHITLELETFIKIGIAVLCANSLVIAFGVFNLGHKLEYLYTHADNIETLLKTANNNSIHNADNISGLLKSITDQLNANLVETATVEDTVTGMINDFIADERRELAKYFGKDYSLIAPDPELLKQIQKVVEMLEYAGLTPAAMGYAGMASQPSPEAPAPEAPVTATATATATSPAPEALAPQALAPQAPSS